MGGGWVYSHFGLFPLSFLFSNSKKAVFRKTVQSDKLNHLARPDDSGKSEHCDGLCEHFHSIVHTFEIFYLVIFYRTTTKLLAN